MDHDDIIPTLSSARALPDERLGLLDKRSRHDHWPKYRVQYYKYLLQEYMARHELSPQKLYDEIMEPEILQNIRLARAARGADLKRSHARPHPGNSGRDIIRYWLHKYPESVNTSFLKFVRRFVLKNRQEFLGYEDARQKVLEGRAVYQANAIADILSERQSLQKIHEYFEEGVRYQFLLLPKKSKEGLTPRIFQIRVFASSVGEFHIFDTDGYELFEGTDDDEDGYCTTIKKRDVRLQGRGYLWAPAQSAFSRDTLRLETLFVTDFDDMDRVSRQPSISHTWGVIKLFYEEDLSEAHETSYTIDQPVLLTAAKPHMYFTSGSLWLSDGNPFSKNEYKIHTLVLSESQLRDLEILEGSFIFV